MKSLEIRLNDRIAQVKLMEQDGNRFIVAVDDQPYEARILQVERGVYLLLMNGKSFNIELIETEGAKRYTINTYRYTYDAEIIDAESRYRQSRHTDQGDDELFISSPMPGKVVRILVKPGDAVKAGDTVIIVSAMKMESEYTVKKDRIIREIKVSEGDTVEANQPLIIIE